MLPCGPLCPNGSRDVVLSTTRSVPTEAACRSHSLSGLAVILGHVLILSFSRPLLCAHASSAACSNPVQTNGSVYNKNKHKVKHYKTKKCKGCELREFCTRNKNGRFIERGIYQEDLEQNEQRVNKNPNYYRQRQQITEHQFGTLKRQWGFTYTLMKGKENVLSEVYLCFSVYNLLRMVQILGVDELRKRLKRLSLFFLWYMACFKTQCYAILL